MLCRYRKKGSHTFLRHLRSLDPLKDTPLPTILMEPVLTTLPMDLAYELGEWFAAFERHRMEEVMAWCSHLVQGSKDDAVDNDDLEVSLVIVVEAVRHSGHGD